MQKGTGAGKSEITATCSKLRVQIGDEHMMYPYMTLNDETEIVHSQIIDEGKTEKVLVHFERPTENGFDSARCELPSYTWIFREGYTDQEISFFEQLLQSNAHLIFKYARSGGVNIA